MPDADLPPTRTTRITSGSARIHRARRASAAMAMAALAIVGVSCSSTTTSEPSASSTTTTAKGASASTYGTIAALHQAIVDGGFECTLEYPGLRDDATSNEVSICTIKDETAYLTIWGDPANLAAFASSSDGSTGTVALGADWSVAVTTPALATEIATALGGTAPSGSAGTTSTAG